MKYTSPALLDPGYATFDGTRAHLHREDWPEAFGGSRLPRVARTGFDVTDETFVPEVEARGARLVKGKTSQDADVIALGAKNTNDLAQLRALRRSMKPAAAVWVTWPKGNKALREDDVRRVAKEVGPA